ncbi:MAG: hypothetical protein HKN67_07305 [Saprospiraceae bacterium]|nr:hypothetical protein [Saprospiraceae bacterium]
MLEKEKPIQIIQVSYYYPPIHSIAVNRTFTLSKALSDIYGEVNIITQQIDARASKDQTFNIPQSINVVRVPKFDYRNIITMFSKSGNIHLSDDQRRNWFSQFIIKVINTIPFNFFLGEGGLWYILKGYAKAKRLVKPGRTTMVISSFRPYADHYIGWLLKRRFKNLIWIADFRDLHVDPLYKQVFFPMWQKRLNKRILKASDLVLTVSEGLAQSLLKILLNVRVLHNPVTATTITQNEDKYNLFTISYVGSLYGEERDPTIFIRSLFLLLNERIISPDNFQFIYAGKDETRMRAMFKKENVDQIFISKGFVSRDESLVIQQKSHVNLLLTSSIAEMPGILTGKLFEYLSGFNPIITLINGERDPIFEKIYRKFKLGNLVYNSEIQSVKQLAVYIKELIEKYQINLPLLDLNSRYLAQQEYSWDKMIPALFDPVLTGNAI